MCKPARVTALVLVLLTQAGLFALPAVNAAQLPSEFRYSLPLVLSPGAQPYRYALPQVGGPPPICAVVAQIPADNAVFLGGQTFTTIWRLRNLSNSPWKADSAVIQFDSGSQLGADPGPSQIPHDVSPLEMIDISMRLTAPSNSGAYRSTWVLKEGEKPLCRFYIQIRVP